MIGGYPSHTKAVHSIIKITPRQLNPNASCYIKKPTLPTQTIISEILLPVKRLDFSNVPDEKSVKPGSSIKENDIFRAEELPKETVSKICTKRNHSDIQRAKVLPRNVKLGSSIKENYIFRAEELPKKTVSNSFTKRNHSDIQRAKVLPRNVKPGSSIKENDIVIAKELRKETVSKISTKRNHSDIQRAKISPRIETSASCTKKKCSKVVDKEFSPIAKVVSKPNLEIMVEKQNVRKYLSWFTFHIWPYIIKDVSDVNKASFSIFHKWRHK